MEEISQTNLRRGIDSKCFSLIQMSKNGEDRAIQKRLVHAHRRQKSSLRKHLKYLASFTILAAVVGGAWYGSGYLGVLLQRPLAITEAPHKAAQPEAPQFGVARTAMPAVDERDVHAIVQAREARFQGALRRLASMLVPSTSESSSIPGSEAIRERITPYIERAQASRDDGDVDSALRLLSEAESEASAMAREADTRYRLALQAARDAHAARTAGAAQTYIEQALEQWPNSVEAQDWQVRIAKLPEILLEYRKVDEARAGGDLRSEAAALRRITALDPDDSDAKQRVRAIEKEIFEQDFATIIGQGWRALEGNDLGRAKQAVATAERQKPQHEETLRLKAGLAELERIQTRDRQLAAAERTAVQDDWESALRAFEQAAALDPNDGSAVEGKGIATRIVAAQRAIDDFLARPDRLSEPAIARTARKAIADAAVLAALSSRLETGSRELERMVEAMQTPVQVLILSDNDTDIGIRGVGRIGRVEKRIVELRPGTYLFEGKRKGYRSKLVEVTIDGGGSPPVEVRIICDERV